MSVTHKNDRIRNDGIFFISLFKRNIKKAQVLNINPNEIIISEMYEIIFEKTKSNEFKSDFNVEFIEIFVMFDIFMESYIFEIMVMIDLLEFIFIFVKKI